MRRTADAHVVGEIVHRVHFVVLLYALALLLEAIPPPLAPWFAIAWFAITCGIAGIACGIACGIGCPIGCAI